jgi:hypothetical protein
MKTQMRVIPSFSIIPHPPAIGSGITGFSEKHGSVTPTSVISFLSIPFNLVSSSTKDSMNSRMDIGWLQPSAISAIFPTMRTTSVYPKTRTRPERIRSIIPMDRMSGIREAFVESPMTTSPVQHPVIRRKIRGAFFEYTKQPLSCLAFVLLAGPWRGCAGALSSMKSPWRSRSARRSSSAKSRTSARTASRA